MLCSANARVEACYNRFRTPQWRDQLQDDKKKAGGKTEDWSRFRGRECAKYRDPSHGVCSNRHSRYGDDGLVTLHTLVA